MYVTDDVVRFEVPGGYSGRYIIGGTPSMVFLSFTYILYFISLYKNFKKIKKESREEKNIIK